jgi:hypothetical protein
MQEKETEEEEREKGRNKHTKEGRNVIKEQKRTEKEIQGKQEEWNKQINKNKEGIYKFLSLFEILEGTIHF